MADSKLKNFTIENGIYKGQVERHLTHYKSFGEVMWTSIKSHGNKIAQVDALTEETVTYAELQDKVVRCALWLQKCGVKSGDIISLCMGNHLNSVVPCLAAAYISAIFNPWNENLDLQTMPYFLQMMTPKVIFCSEKSVNVVLSVVEKQNFTSTVVGFGKHVGAISFSDILKNCNDEEVANFRYVELDDVKKTACILHSSGTTGLPKGVQLSNYSLINVSQEINMNMANVASLWYSALFWVTGTALTFNGIVQGTKLIIYPEFNEEINCRLIEKYKIEAAFFSTSMINRLLNSDCLKKYSLLSLKTIMFGGAAVKPKAQEELRRIWPHAQILQCYGMTELNGLASMQLPNSKNGSCGITARNVQMKVVDPKTGKLLGPNQAGEICIKLPNIMTGYYKNPEATKSILDEEKWLHTGDIGYVDEDGEWFILDRLKELIKYRGYQICPGEIENVLTSHPAVLNAAVIGMPHETDDEHPIACIIKKPGAKVTEQELIDFVAKNMMDHCKLRGGVIFLDSFLYTGTGKVSKKYLRDIVKKERTEMTNNTIFL